MARERKIKSPKRTNVSVQPHGQILGRIFSDLTAHGISPFDASEYIRIGQIKGLSPKIIFEAAQNLILNTPKSTLDKYLVNPNHHIVRTKRDLPTPTMPRFACFH